MSPMCRNAARSSPISTNALCMPGSTRATLPRQMLPTSPRALARSTWSSCTTACSSIATRVSCGVTLIRISCVVAARSPGRATSVRRFAMAGGSGPAFNGARSEDRHAGAHEQRRRLVERQADDAAVAAFEARDERGGEALHRIAAGLVERLAGRDVTLELGGAEAAQRDARNGYLDVRAVVVAERDRGQHLMRAAGEA